MLGTLTRLGALLLLLTTVFLILPTSQGLPDGAFDAIQSVIGFLYAWDFILPVDTILTIFGLAVAFEVGVFLWRFIKWITHLVAGTSAGST